MSVFYIFLTFFNVCLHLQCAVAPIFGRSGTDQSSIGLVSWKGTNYWAKTYRLDMSGKCQDKIEILRNVDKGLYAALKVPCSESNRNILVPGQEAIVGTPNSKFCAFTMMRNPNVLITILDGQCKTITYNRNTMVERTFEDEDCVEVVNIITEIEKNLKPLVDPPRASNPSQLNDEIVTLENILIDKLKEYSPIQISPPLPRPSQPSGSEYDNSPLPAAITVTKFQPTSKPTTNNLQQPTTEGQNNNGDIRGDDHSPSLSTSGGSMTFNNGLVSRKGTNYWAKTYQLDTRGKCEDKIEILRNTDNGLYATFKVPCSESNRKIFVEGQEALVGTPNSNFCAFAMMRKENILIIILNGECKTILYNRKTTVERTFEDEDCAEVAKIITIIEQKLKSQGRYPGLYTEIVLQENILINTLEGLKPKTISSPLTRPSQPSAEEFDNTPQPTTVTGTKLQPAYNGRTKVQYNNEDVSGDDYGSSLSTSGGSVTSNNGLVSRKGEFYWAKIYRLDTPGKCQDQIEILRNADNGLYAAFKVPCSESNKKIFVEGQEALVGTPNSKFYAFTMMRKPNILIITLNGECKTVLYNRKTIVERTFEDKDCAEVAKTITNIEQKLKSLVSNPSIYKQIAIQENILINTLESLKPKTISSPLTRPSQPSAEDFDDTPQPAATTITQFQPKNNARTKVQDISGDDYDTSLFTSGDSVTSNNGEDHELDHKGTSEDSPQSIPTTKDSAYKKGDSYWAKVYKLQNRGKCEDKIEISKYDEGGIYADFTAPCLDSNKQIFLEGDELLVGTPSSKFCVFAMRRKPKTLFVIQYGDCKRISYSSAYILEETFTIKDCTDLKNRIKRIEDKLKLLLRPDVENKQTIISDIGKMENKLVQELIWFKPTVTVKRPFKSAESVGTVTSQPTTIASQAVKNSYGAPNTDKSGTVGSTFARPAPSNMEVPGGYRTNPYSMGLIQRIINSIWT